MFSTNSIIANPRLRVSIVYGIVFALLLVMTVYLTGVLRQAHYRDLQLETIQRLSAISAKLQGIVTNNLSLISGLAAHIAINPDIHQSEFERYVKAVFEQQPILINMAAAPDLIVKLVYPLYGNSGVIGLDYRKNVEQFTAVQRAIKSRKMVIAGPVELVQGGSAFIGRKAIYTYDREFWGIVSAPIDANSLYLLAGLSDKNSGTVVAIRGHDALGSSGNVFFGNSALFEDQRSIKVEIELGDGKWVLAAQPQAGWASTPDTIWVLYIGSAILFLLLNLFTFFQVRQILSDQNYRKKLHQHAVYDQLTGLPNRFLFEDRLEKAIDRAERDNIHLAILFIDLDNFKAVNDNLGHKAGDVLLRIVAQRITNSVRESDIAARYSGDEFMLIVQDIQDINSPALIAGNILRELSKPYNLGENQVFCTASIGISMFPEDAQTIGELISKADQAMYQAKNSGRNNSQYFTQEMQVHSENRHHLYNKLVKALVDQALEVHYQPIVNMADGSIQKCEALVRWFDSDEQINTVEFISLAEETGMINDIDRFVLETSVDFLITQSKLVNFRLGLSVNLSPRLFTTNDNSLDDWLAVVSKAIKVIDLTVEITERLLTEESAKVFEVLNELKVIGVTIAIDDFGTGYSSLNYLIKFPIDIIKIDRAFISQLGVDEKAEALTEAVIGLSKKLSMPVVAEGVETEEQLVYLRKWGCDYCQGYYFSKPLCSLDFASLLNNNSKLESAK